MSQPSERLLALGRELAGEQDRRLAQDLSLGLIRNELTELREPSRWRPRLVLGLALLAALGALAAVVVEAPAPPLWGELASRRLVAGDWLRNDGAPLLLHFSDGAEFVLGTGSRGRLTSIDTGHAELVVEAGALAGRGTAQNAAHYRLRLGPFTAELEGDTRFEASFRPSDELFTLSVSAGRASVSGCVLGEGRTLFSGEELSASCPAGHFEIAAAKPRPLVDGKR